MYLWRNKKVLLNTAGSNRIKRRTGASHSAVRIFRDLRVGGDFVIDDS